MENKAFQKVLEQISLLDPQSFYNLLQNLKSRFGYYLNNQEAFINLFSSFGIKIDDEIFFELTADVELKNKIKAMYDIVLSNRDNPYVAYIALNKVMGYKNLGLDTIITSKKAIAMAKKSYKTAKFIGKSAVKTAKYTGKAGMKVFRLLLWLLGLIWDFFLFLFTAPGLIFIAIVSIVIIAITIILIILSLLYQPLLNVPVKFSSYEMYVPLNNNEVAFKNVNAGMQELNNKVKENFNVTSKVLDTLTANLTNKNTIQLFLKNNQADLAKGFVYKCSKYSLVKNTILEYSNERKNLSGALSSLSGQLNQLENKIEKNYGILSGYNNQKAIYTKKLLDITDQIGLYTQIKNHITYSGDIIIEYDGVNISTGTNISNMARLELLGTGYYLAYNGGVYNLVVNKQNGEKVLKYIGTLGKKITSLENEQNKYSKFINQVSEKINNLKQEIEDLKQEKDNLLTKVNELTAKLDTLENKFKEKLKALGVENADSSLIQGDLFNGGLGVNRVFYAWYIKELEEKGYKINDTICSDTTYYGYVAYIAPSWKKYTEAMAPGGTAYTMLFLDNINNGKDKEVDNGITQKDYDIFQKYYNSIVELYKQLGDIMILKNWISGKFTVRPQGLLGMDVRTNDDMSVINIYNPFLFLKNSITLLDDNDIIQPSGTKKKYIEYNNFKVDISKFNNWFYDIGANNITNLSTDSAGNSINNGLDIIFDTNTKDTYIPINVDNNFINNVCGIQANLTNKNNLTMFIKINGEGFYNKAKQYVETYNSCVAGCKKNCNPYESCYKPIFINGEKKDKQQELSNAYNNQTSAYCTQIENYLKNYGALTAVKQDKFEKEPSKIQVCYEEKPVFFNYMFKYNVKAYYHADTMIGSYGKVETLVDTREDKYHYTANGMYVPYLYKVRLPYKVCYTIDNIYLTKSLKDKLIKKGGVVKNYNTNNGKLGFVLDSHIDLDLKSDVFFKGNNYPTVWETEKLMFDLLNKGAQFNPEKLLNILAKKQHIFSTYYLGLSIKQNKDNVIYNGGDFNVGPGKEKLNISNSKVFLSTRYTNKIKRDTSNNMQINGFGYIYTYYTPKVFGNGYKIQELLLNSEGVINTLYRYDNILIKNFKGEPANIGADKLIIKMGSSLDYDRDEFKDGSFMKTIIDNNVINTFKLKENLYLATTLNFIKSQLFNVDLANLKQANNIQSLLYMGDKKQVNTYYTLHIANTLIKDKITGELDIKLGKFEKELNENLQKVKNKYDEAKNIRKNKGVRAKITGMLDSIAESVDGLFNSALEIAGNITKSVANDLEKRFLITMSDNIIPKSCVLSANPAKCALDNINLTESDNIDMLDKMYKEFVLSNAKPGINLGTKDNKFTMGVLLGDSYNRAIYTQAININNIILNPFYTLFRKTEDKKTEEGIGIYSVASNVLTTNNPNNVLKTLNIDKYNLEVLVGNMLGNNYIIDRLSTALKNIKISGLDTTALDNLSNVKYDDVDIYKLNRVLFTKFNLFKILDNLKENLISYYKTYGTKERAVNIKLYNLWFIYHANEKEYALPSSPLISQIDKVLRKTLGEAQFDSLVKKIQDHNIHFDNDYAWYDIVSKFNDKNKQYLQYKEVIEVIRKEFDNIYLCLDPSQEYKFDNNIIMYKEPTNNISNSTTGNTETPSKMGALQDYCSKIITLKTDSNLKTNKLFIQYLLGIDDTYLDNSVLKGLIDTAKFIAYYGNREYKNSSVDLIELYSVATKDNIYNESNLYIDIVLKSKKYLSQGFTDLNMDTNFLYKLWNGSKIGKQNDITYTTYLVNFFTQVDHNIGQLKSLFKLITNLKKDNKIYEIADVYLLDLLANQNNYLSNINFVSDIHTYTQLKNYINSTNLPMFSQYSLFDAVSIKGQLGYLKGFNNSLDMDNYYFTLFKKSLKDRIDCEKTFSGDNILVTKCGLIKADLLNSANLTDFKFKMTKYAKEYEFEDLWKQVGGLLYFVYQNQKYLGQAWDIRTTDEYKQLEAKYGTNFYTQIAGVKGNCTRYTNYLHFKDQVGNGKKNGIRGNAKDWCKNAEAMGYKVKYTKDIVNLTSQLKIGDMVVFNDLYPTYYNYQMKKYGKTYGHVGTLIGIDDQNDAILVEEMNFTSIIKGGSTLWVVDRRWDTDWHKSTKCFIEAGNFNWSYDNTSGTGTDK